MLGLGVLTLRTTTTTDGVIVGQGHALLKFLGCIHSSCGVIVVEPVSLSLK